MIAGIGIALVVGIALGYIIWGRRGGALNSRDFFDPEEIKTFGREGRAAVAARIERRKEKIMEKAVAQGRITNDGVEELFCISDRTATVYLGSLVKEGRLERAGSGRGTYYTPR